MSLEKVLRLTQPAEVAPDPTALVRLAAEDLERIALMLAQADADEDDDGEGDDDTDDDEDEDDGDDSKGGQDSAKAKLGKGKKPFPGKGQDSKGGKSGKKVPPWLAKKQEKVKASRALVQEAMVALSQLEGGEALRLSAETKDTPAAKASVVLRLARGGADVAMEHGPMTGEHEHPHRVVNVHSHRHTHNADSRHACGDAGYGAF